MKNQDRGGGMQDSKAGEARRSALLHPGSGILDPVSLQRVRWRCRRGLLELDIVLGRFVEQHYARLGESERQAFDALLDMPDNPLWDMIAGRAERGVQQATRQDQQALLEKIRAV